MSSKWDSRFFKLATEIAEWSPDPRTKVGAVIVGRNNEILSTGYNGLPRGADHSWHTERLERPEKLFWFEHAERNAIYNAAKIGISLDESILYTTLCPCMDCARAVVQVGIRRVHTNKPDFDKYPLWKDSFQRSLALFKEVGVILEFKND